MAPVLAQTRGELIEIVPGEAQAGQRHDQLVLPVHMAAVTLEEAAEHVAQHLGVGGAAALAERFQRLGDLGGEVIVGGMLGGQPLEDLVDAVLRLGPGPQKRKQPLLLVMVVQRQVILQAGGNLGAEAAIHLVRQAIGDALHRVAHLHQQGMGAGDHVQRV